MTAKYRVLNYRDGLIHETDNEQHARALVELHKSCYVALAGVTLASARRQPTEEELNWWLEAEAMTCQAHSVVPGKGLTLLEKLRTGG